MPRTRKADQTADQTEPIDIVEPTGIVIDDPTDDDDDQPVEDDDEFEPDDDDTEDDAEPADDDDDDQPAATASRADRANVNDGIDDIDGIDDVPVGGGVYLDLTRAEPEFELIAPKTRVLLVVTAADGLIATSGNLMITLRVKIERVLAVPPGVSEQSAQRWRNRTIRENLLFIPDDPDNDKRGTLWRTWPAFDALGVPKPTRPFRTQTEAVEWARSAADQMLGGIAEAMIGIEQRKPNDPKNIDPATGQPYPQRNVIDRWLKAAAVVTVPPTNDDDDIPF